MRAAQTGPQEPRLYLQHLEAASFQYVIHPTYGRSANWTLTASQPDTKEPGLYLEEVETTSLQCVIHPTYGRSANWTARTQ
jgi:hypothetical protein